MCDPLKYSRDTQIQPAQVRGLGGPFSGSNTTLVVHGIQKHVYRMCLPAPLTSAHTAIYSPSYANWCGRAHASAHTATYSPSYASDVEGKWARALLSSSFLVGCVPVRLPFCREEEQLPRLPFCSLTRSAFLSMSAV